MKDTKTSGTVKKVPAKTADKATAPKVAVPERDCFTFGSYWQESSNEKTPIEWLVLKQSGTKALLISRYGLDCKQYHHERVDMTWENCDLRKWLNGEFLRNAFTAAEQKKIAVTKLQNENNVEYGTVGGNSTEDRVFCLSLSEAENLFKDDEARKCVPTPYTVVKACWQCSSEFIDGRACCCWWLRSPGQGRDRAICVDADGIPYLPGITVFEDEYVVRPALWVNL